MKGNRVIENKNKNGNLLPVLNEKFECCFGTN